MVARLPTPMPSSIGYLLFAATSRGAIARLLAERALRPDLRALLVGRAVRRARARHAEDPRLRRHGFAEVARVRAATSRFRCRSATGSEGAKLRARGEAPRAALRPLHGDHARRVGDAARATAPASPTDWFPERRRQRILRARPTSRTTPTRSASSGAWTTTRTRSACSTSARTCCRCCRRGGPASKLAIVGADPSPAVRELGELPGVTVTGSVPDVRPYVRALGADGRAAATSRAARRTRFSRRWRWACRW